MSTKDQGELLRLWRTYLGEARGRPLTLKEAALMISAAAARRGNVMGSRSIPCTHASLTRWELGNVQQKVEGMGIIAEAYGVTAMDLMGPPPGYPRRLP